MHLAGGFDRHGYWLDAHSGGLHPELLALAAEVLPQLCEVRAVVYEILPEFVVQDGRDVLRPDLESVQRLVADVRRRSIRTIKPTTPLPAEPRPIDGPRGAEPAEWEQTLASLAIGRSLDGRSELATELAADPGIDLLRELVGAGRSGRVASSLPLTLELLVCCYGLAEVDELLDSYAAATEPALWGSDEGRRFAAWAEGQFADSPVVLAALRLDCAGLESVRTNRPQVVELDVDPVALINTIRHDQPVTDLDTGRFLVTVGDT